MKMIPPSRRRHLRTFVPGEGPAELTATNGQNEPIRLIDLASNDYLGLSRHPELIAAATRSIHSLGIGAGGSRLVTGSRPVHTHLEKELANWLGREHVLVFPSGFQANLAGVIALSNRHTYVLADRLSHYSLLAGVKASGALLQRYAHNDLQDLERYLKLNSDAETPKKTLVITESLFSMEGSSPPLKEIVELCEEYGAKLMLDEAHALGVIGNEGRGLGYGISEPLTMISGTFGKAFGSGGAFLASDSVTGDQLLQNSGAFRYTTALAPPLTAAALAALKLIKGNPDWRDDLLNQSESCRTQLANAGWPRPPGHGPIISLIIGADQEALDLQTQLETAGLLSMAIRPPTVPEGTARLRIVLRKDLPKDTLNKLIMALKKP